MSILSTLLTPYKGYVAAAGLALAVSAFGWYTYHERAVEHAKDVAVATHEVAKVDQQDKTIAATATTEIQHDQVILKQIVSLPPVGDLGELCEPAGSRAVPGAASGDGSRHAAAVSVPADVFDPSGDLLTLARSEDALVRDLQAENAALRAEMIAAQKAH